MKRKSWFRFFDRFEDRVRGKLSKVPIFYAFLGGASVVLFWRGVWHTADMVVPFFFRNSPLEVLEKAMILDGPITILISSILLLSAGLVVSSFIGTNIIISGIKNEKKLEEKEAEEIETEEYILHSISNDIKKIKEELGVIKNKMEK